LIIVGKRGNKNERIKAAGQSYKYMREGGGGGSRRRRAESGGTKV